MKEKRNGCEGKHKYLSEKTASDQLDIYKALRKKNKRFKRWNVKRTYKCYHCGFWHLTSKEVRK